MDLNLDKILKGIIILAILSWCVAYSFKLDAIDAKLDLVNAKLDRVQYNLK